MKVEKLIADELQCMFLEGQLQDFKEDYINFLTRKLWIGEISVNDLIKEEPKIKDKVSDAVSRISFSSIKRDTIIE
ncbi:hypothetical protein [Heyndrickxia camelliae]|uniref:Uncharacterized protein n=1 Tax=Heyndrickxia camelliae TaxID=1707093 RepID=A0A2N3LQE9_9BACI|nr:hypothetical protein [Heyndrickxia camelliae]PKR86815.1 hypothetical protein CWO92_01790 [Heyndrickxia camelliae]